MSLGFGDVRDKNIDYLMRRQFVTPILFIQAATANAVSAPATLTAGFAGTSAIYQNVAATGFGGLQFSSTAATATAVWRPYDMDNRWPVYVRYAWSTNAAVASVATFTSRFGILGAGAAISTAS